MTGWRARLRRLAAAFADELLKAQEPVHGNASSVSQKAAEAALAGDQTHVAQMRAAYGHRRDLALALLADAGVDHVVPQGAFYVMVDISALGDSLSAATDAAAGAARLDRPGAGLRPARRGLGPRVAVRSRRPAGRRARPGGVAADRGYAGRIACGGSVSRSR